MGDDVDLRSTLGAAPIQRDVVRVDGPEAVDYLQGQLSQDVAALAIGASAPSLLLQPSGKVDAWLRITRVADDAVLLDVEAGFGDQVTARLNRFKLRTKADVALDRWAGLALRGPGAAGVEVPAGALALPAGWPGVEGVDLLSDGEVAIAGAQLVDHEAVEALRIECGVPANGAELTDSTIPAEAGQWLIDTSVSFTKGCYTGQELVARIDSRGGNVPRPLRGLRLADASAVPGATVRHAGSDVGVVTSAARSVRLGGVALATVARSVEPGAAVEVHGPDGTDRPATVTELPMR